MSDYTVGIRLNGDASGLVGATKEASASQKELAAQFKATGTLQQDLAAQTKSMAGAQDVARQSIRGHTSDQRALDDELTRFLAVADKGYRQTLLLDRGHDLLTRGLAQGIINQKQYDSYLASITARYGPAALGASALAGAHGKVGNQTAFAARETRALFDEYMRGNKSQMTGTALLLATRLTGVGGSALLAAGAIGAVVGVFGLFVAKAESLNRTLNATQALLEATGRGGIIARPQLQALVEQLALLPGQSSKSAEATVAALAKVRNVGGGYLADLARLSGDFAVATGVKVPQAAAALAKAFDDPTKGAKQLDEQLNFLSAEQLLAIERFQRQGDILSAQRVLYDALAARIKGLAENSLTPLQRSFEGVGNAWHEASRKLSDSSGITTATNLVIKFADKVSWLIENLPKLGELEKKYIPAVGQVAGLIGHFGGAGGAGPTVSGRIGAGTGAGAPPAGPTAYDDLVKQALGSANQYDSTSRKMHELSDSSKLLSSALEQMRAHGETGTETYRRLQEGLAGVHREMKRLTDLQNHDAIEAAKKAQKAIEDGAKAYQQSIDAQTKQVAALEDANKKLATNVDEIGLTKDQLESLKIARAADALATQQQAEAMSALYAASPAELELEHRRTEALKERLELLYKEQAATTLAEKSKQQLDEFKRNTKEMERSLTDALLRGFENGESFGRNFWKTMVNMAATAVLKPLIEPVISPFAKAGAGVSAGIGGLFDNLFNTSGLPSAATLGTLSDQAATNILVGAAGLHSGGAAGNAGFTRFIHPAYFENAPRFHQGSMGVDEIPAILKRGERVYTPEQDAARGGAAPMPVTVTVVNNGTPQRVKSSNQSFNAKGMLVSIVTEDLATGGMISAGLERTYGLQRAGG